MFDQLTDADHESIEELGLTALSPLQELPVPGLVRAFHWLECRRTERKWVLYELGLLMLRGALLRSPEFAGLAAALLDEAKRRKSGWLAVLGEPAPLAPHPPRPRAKSGEYEARRRAFLQGYDLGAKFQMIAVIALPVRGRKRAAVTVWGFRAGKARWPSAAETRKRRRAVRAAREGSARLPDPLPRRRGRGRK